MDVVQLPCIHHSKIAGDRKVPRAAGWRPCRRFGSGAARRYGSPAISGPYRLEKTTSFRTIRGSRENCVRLRLSLLLRVPDQGAVIAVRHRFQPLRGGLLSRQLPGQVREPAVRRSAVPVLYPGGDPHHVAGL